MGESRDFRPITSPNLMDHWRLFLSFQDAIDSILEAGHAPSPKYLGNGIRASHLGSVVYHHLSLINSYHFISRPLSSINPYSFWVEDHIHMFFFSNKAPPINHISSREWLKYPSSHLQAIYQPYLHPSG